MDTESYRKAAEWTCSVQALTQENMEETVRQLEQITGEEIPRRDEASKPIVADNEYYRYYWESLQNVQRLSEKGQESESESESEPASLWWRFRYAVANGLQSVSDWFERISDRVAGYDYD